MSTGLCPVRTGKGGDALPGPRWQRQGWLKSWESSLVQMRRVGRVRLRQVSAVSLLPLFRLLCPHRGDLALAQEAACVCIISLVAGLSPFAWTKRPRRPGDTGWNAAPSPAPEAWEQVVERVACSPLSTGKQSTREEGETVRATSPPWGKFSYQESLSVNRKRGQAPREATIQKGELFELGTWALGKGTPVWQSSTDGPDLLLAWSSWGSGCVLGSWVPGDESEPGILGPGRPPWIHRFVHPERRIPGKDGPAGCPKSWQSRKEPHQTRV